jgi:hypothetical protein
VREACGGSLPDGATSVGELQDRYAAIRDALVKQAGEALAIHNDGLAVILMNLASILDPTSFQWANVCALMEHIATVVPEAMEQMVIRQHLGTDALGQLFETLFNEGESGGEKGH